MLTFSLGVRMLTFNVNRENNREGSSCSLLVRQKHNLCEGRMNNVEVVCPLIINQWSAGSSRDKTVDRESECGQSGAQGVERRERCVTDSR